jgi:hypothetical protein
MRPFFRSKATGLNADLARHTKEEKNLKAKILELEQIPEPDQFDLAFLKSYKELLAKLMQSKAEVLSNLGKKKIN